jgi:ANTAR domain
LSSRSVIDQAIGIVMAQQGGGPEDAFAALRTISQRRNIKLRTIAAELVEATRRRSQHTHRKPDQAPQAGAGCPSWAHAALSLSTCVSGVR